jgi:hypothetical protein
MKLRAHDLPITIPNEGLVFLMRDDAMDAHQETHGSVPMPDGESVLVLWFGRNEKVPGFHYMDLVTVDDPFESEFSWWAVEQLWDVYLESKREKKGSS